MQMLIALHASEYAEIVLEHGLDQAARKGATDLHFVTVVATDEEIPSARAWLDALVRDGLDTFALGDRHVELHVVRGRTAAVIAALAADLAVDLLVIGQFHVPSEADILVSIVERPVLVIGIDGHVLEAQCPACREVRETTAGEQLFCAEHSSDRLPDLTSRVPPHGNLSSRMW